MWLFGAILALVSAHTIYPITWPDRENDAEWTKIKLTEHDTVRVPGVDLTIDLTAPEGIRIINLNSTSWHEFQDLVYERDREASIQLWPILIESLVILLLTLLLGLIARYISETALIRMVKDTEESGRRLRVGEGLRRGWSVRTWRLSLLDLLIGFVAAVRTPAGF